MDYTRILDKIKDLNQARKVLEEEIEERINDAIRDRVTKLGYQDNDGVISYDIPTHVATEVTPKNHSNHCFIHEVYIDPETDTIKVIGSYEILLDDEDVDCPLSDIDIDGKIAILQSMIGG